MASSSSECSSDDEKPQSESASSRILPVPWTKESSTKPRGGSILNSYKNDGSFLEMFKKMQEQNNQQDTNQSTKSLTAESKLNSSNSIASSESDDTAVQNSTPNKAVNKSVNKFVGKRRPTRVLPTGLVKKQRKDGSNDSVKESSSGAKNDPWSKYMDEVRKYKQQSCSEEESTRRPLVK